MLTDCNRRLPFPPPLCRCPWGPQAGMHWVSRVVWLLKRFCFVLPPTPILRFPPPPPPPSWDRSGFGGLSVLGFGVSWASLNEIDSATLKVTDSFCSCTLLNQALKTHTKHIEIPNANGTPQIRNLNPLHPKSLSPKRSA